MKRMLPIIISVALSSCATDVANRYYMAERYPAKEPKQVAILLKAPAHPFEIIADLQARNESPKAMQKQAAKIGADAVIVTLLGGYSDRAEQWAEAPRSKYVTYYAHIVGTAIKYKP